MADLSPAIFVHEAGICESSQVGEGTRVWAFAHVLPGARLGRDCNICDHVFIENDVVVGDRVTVKSGVQLWDGTRIGDDVFIGPNATFTNDRFPRSKHYPDAFAGIVVEPGASIGANATILPGLRLGRASMVGAGAVVTKDVPAQAVVVGNPATVIGYLTGSHDDRSERSREPESFARTELGVGGCALVRLPCHIDPRGALTPIEFERLPFRPRRIFYLYQVPSGQGRGEHGHRVCHQFLIALHGGVSVLLRDRTQEADVTLTDPAVGLHVPPGVWVSLRDFVDGAVLMVLASHPYDRSDYIDDYEEFRRHVGGDEDVR